MAVQECSISVLRYSPINYTQLSWKFPAFTEPQYSLSFHRTLTLVCILSQLHLNHYSCFCSTVLVLSHTYAYEAS